MTRSSLISLFFVAAAAVACSSSSGGTGSNACTGSAPSCFGNDSNSCCGQDPAGQAVCSSGAWTCGGAPAPGCNGQSCLHPQDGGTGADASGDAGPDDGSSLDSANGCSGSAPLCFGNDDTHCCGQDPAGTAVCGSGGWKCGSSPAPGCNGQSCLLGDSSTD